MLSVVIASSAKRRQDEIDIEFDAVAKTDQVKCGIRYNGLHIVGKEPEAVPAPTPVQKRGMRQFFEQIVFGESAS